ncbi:MAG: hypothetical protein M3Y24_00735 [Acidobacteriota bacterium]|nr:hypothetical protein [Acidobacteriota bacterium]
MRQIRVPQVLVSLLLFLTEALCFNMWPPFLPPRMQVIDAQRINIRERDGTIKAVLFSSEGFGNRAKQGIPANPRGLTCNCASVSA